MSAKRTDGKLEGDGLTLSIRNRGIIAICPTPQHHGTFDCMANAEFIKTAWNSHNQLVAACKELREYVRTHRSVQKITLAEINADKALALAKKDPA